MNLKSLMLGAMGGAALVYFLDPETGKRRRNMARDRSRATLRSSAQKGEQAARVASSQAQGVTHKVASIKQQKPQPDDVTLARKVESEIFRDADAPKGRVNVDAVNGVVTLRGELDSEDQIQELEKAARKVQGVGEVQNLLHTPGTPAPTSA
jgi:osmotically-inducible protein OsmY